MADDDVKIVITADALQLVQAADKVISQLDGIEREALSLSKIDPFSGSVGGAAKLALSAQKVATQLDAVEREARQVAQTEPFDELASDAAKLTTESQKVATKLDVVKKEAGQLNNLNPFQGFVGGAVGLNQVLELGQRAISAFKGAVDFVGETDKVIQLQDAFDQFQQAAGRNAVDALQELRAATQGTVSDIDLLTASNKALATGIPADKIVQFAEISKRLGQAVGVDATQAFNDLTVGVARSSREVLDNLGIILGVEEANKAYADSIGKTVDQLTEQEKKIAFTNGALEQGQKKIEALGLANDTAGQAIQRLDAAFENIIFQVQKAIGENDALRDALNDVAKALLTVDVEGLTAAISTFITSAIEATKVTLEFAKSIGVLEGIGDVVKGLGDLIGETAGYAGALSVAITEADSFSGALIKAEEIYLDATKSIEAQTAATKQVAEETKKATTVSVGLNKALKDGDQPRKQTEKELKAIEKAAKEAAAEAERLEKQFLQTQNALLDIAGGAENYEKALEQVEKGQLDAAQAADILQKNYVEARDIAEQITQTQADLNEALKESKYKDNADEVAVLAAELQGLETQLEKVGDVSKKTGGFLDDIFGKDALGDIFGSGFSDAAEGAVFDGIQGIFESVSDGLNREDLASIGGTAGAAIGTAIGGPMGTSIGQAVGDAIGKDVSRIGKSTRDSLAAAFNLYTGGFIGQAIGIDVGGFVVDALGFGESKSESAKKAVDKFFADALDANRLNLVIDGQLQQVRDFTFSGNQTGGLFDTLAADTQASFQNIGLAIESVLGNLEGLGVNTGNVLANNLGGSLNNVQILLTRIGISAEQLQAPLEEAFLSGEISATKARDALQSIQQLAEKGIPGAVGATEESFANLIASAGSGAAAVDALGDIAAEAGEKGITTLAELEADLKGSGRFASEEVDKFIGVLSAQFGDTFLQLEEVSTSAAINAAAALTDVGFAFGPISDELTSLKDTIDAIPRVKDVTVNVRANVSQQDRDLLRQVGSAEFRP
jgi:hypothetical protein